MVTLNICPRLVSFFQTVTFIPPARNFRTGPFAFGASDDGSVATVWVWVSSVVLMVFSFMLAPDLAGKLLLGGEGAVLSRALKNRSFDPGKKHETHLARPEEERPHEECQACAGTGPHWPGKRRAETTAPATVQVEETGLGLGHEGEVHGNLAPKPSRCLCRVVVDHRLAKGRFGHPAAGARGPLANINAQVVS
jgi:hypothetical protein